MRKLDWMDESDLLEAFIIKSFDMIYFEVDKLVLTFAEDVDEPHIRVMVGTLHHIEGMVYPLAVFNIDGQIVVTKGGEL